MQISTYRSLKSMYSSAPFDYGTFDIFLHLLSFLSSWLGKVIHCSGFGQVLEYLIFGGNSSSWSNDPVTLQLRYLYCVMVYNAHVFGGPFFFDSLHCISTMLLVYLLLYSAGSSYLKHGIFFWGRLLDWGCYWSLFLFLQVCIDCYYTRISSGFLLLVITSILFYFLIIGVGVMYCYYIY